VVLGQRSAPGAAHGAHAGHSRRAIRRLLAALVCLAVLAGTPPAVVSAPPRSAVPRVLTGSGYYRLAEVQGTWWLIDPAGRPTVSVGVDDVSYTGDRIRGTGPQPYLRAVHREYASKDAWQESVRTRLAGWGFNTLGAWSDASLDTALPYTVILNFAARAGARWSGTPADVFDPRFEATVRAVAAEVALPRADDHLLLGYFSDNELWWGGDWRNPETMLGAYLSLPADAPGRRAAVAFLRARHGAVARLNRAWGTAARSFAAVPPAAPGAAYHADAAAFLGLVAGRYFAVSARAIHEADPHHLYLGTRFMGVPPMPVLRAARAADVVSINLYVRDPRPAVAAVYAATGRPVLVSEFAFRSLDSGLPNTVGAGPWVFTQRTRAEAYVRYVTRLESQPAAIGYHWFRWADEPAQGRGDGENSNYGLVTVDDHAYREFVRAAAAANRAAFAIHAGTVASVILPRAFAWFRWTLGDMVNELLGGPRWLSTALRALALFMRRPAPAA
jgi:hypothetical protein